TYRIAHMIQRGISPGEILAVTFTNKAAREMQERVSKLISRTLKARQKAEKPERPTLCTFHSLCVRILRQHVEKLGYKRNFVIYDESEQIGAMKRVLAHVSSKGQKLDPQQILGALSRLKNNEGQSTSFVDESLGMVARHLRSRYESALHACNAVDFDDLILLTLRLFREHPDALESCRNKYRFIMVDEYQDTNTAQFRVVHALTQEHRNFCVVGDDDQSIYGWRGAQISNLLDMEKHYPEVKVVKLEQNYRSTNTILGAANAVIKKNLLRRGKSLWSSNGDGTKIVLQTFASDEEEARTIVEQINYARLTRKAPWKEHAILFRTNIQARPLETAPRQAGVRYHLVGGQSFFDRREIRDLLAYLKVSLNTHDDISLLRIANIPARGLSDVTMERLLAASHERKCSVFSAIKNPVVTTTFQSKTRESIERFGELLERLHRPFTSAAGNNTAHGIGLFSLTHWGNAFLDEIGYWDELRRSEKDPENAAPRIRNVKDLVGTLDSGTPEGNTPAERLQIFLEQITLDTEREEEEEAGEAVTLITMHSCKGLEFPHVYIVGLEDGILPHSRSREEGTLDEERRLFYVAITRAMRTLSISHCRTRKKYGMTTESRPSPFLQDLPLELVEHADDNAKKPVEVASGKSMFDALRAAAE
ncbi:MAG: ATP-dependent helicase, partial [Acidobacteriota bacterium]